jgi:hypothetical protein
MGPAVRPPAKSYKTTYYEQTSLGMAPVSYGSYVAREDYERPQHLILCLVGQPHKDPDQIISQLFQDNGSTDGSEGL